MMAKLFTKLAGFRISKYQARRVLADALLGAAVFLGMMYGYLCLIVVLFEKVVL